MAAGLPRRPSTGGHEPFDDAFPRGAIHARRSISPSELRYIEPVYRLPASIKMMRSDDTGASSIRDWQDAAADANTPLAANDAGENIAAPCQMMLPLSRR